MRSIYSIAAMKNLMIRLVNEDAGGELVETALVLGLICLVAIGMMGKVGHSVLQKWTSIYDQL